MICLIKDVKYQSLLKDSGLNELSFNTYVGEFIETYGRWPNLDEIPGANSLPLVKLVFELKENNSTKIDTILLKTNTDSISEAQIKINDRYRDLDIELLPMLEDCDVNIRLKPTVGRILNIGKTVTQDSEISNREALSKIITTLGSKLGVEIIPTTTSELSTDKWSDIITSEVNAFIYDGKIYVNLDNAKADAPIHELTHIFIGSIRFLNPELYSSVVSVVESIPGYLEMIARYPNRTRNDVNEEIFVTEFAKYATGLNSSFDMLSPKELYEIEYNVGRVLDTILMGSYSARNMELSELINESIKSLAQLTQSEEFINQGLGFLNDASIHRIMNNRKSELMKKGILKEECN